MATQRRSYHPPDPGVWALPSGNEKGFIRGSKAVAGFGNYDHCIAVLSASAARALVTKHHYSHTVVNNSFVHLGVYQRNNLVGVLQFGYALNPVQVSHVVRDTSQGEYLELNRMWLSDVAPRNSESMSISYALKYIRHAMPSVAWIQTFADERCGGLGVVYQACNFQFVGEHVTDFYFLDGDFYHRILLTAHRQGTRAQQLLAGVDRVFRLRYRQFRYVFFLKRAWRSRLLLPPQPYPKAAKSPAPDAP